MSSEIEKVAREILDAADEHSGRTAKVQAILERVLSPPSSATPGDWILVPREPTPEMIYAYNTADAAPPNHRNLSTAGYLAMLAAAPQPQEGAGSDAGAYSTGSDREMLNYLMQQFDAEFHACGRCGHEEPTKDYDSAIHLREYLATRPQPASDAMAYTKGDEVILAKFWRGDAPPEGWVPLFSKVGK